MFDSLVQRAKNIVRLLPGNRMPSHVKERMIARRELAAAKADKDAADARHAYWLDEEKRMNFYNDYDFARYVAAGSPPVVGTDRQLEFITPPPTPEQWAKLTPEQKANTANPILPENLP